MTDFTVKDQAAWDALVRTILRDQGCTETQLPTSLAYIKDEISVGRMRLVCDPNDDGIVMNARLAATETCEKHYRTQQKAREELAAAEKAKAEAQAKAQSEKPRVQSRAQPQPRGLLNPRN